MAVSASSGLLSALVLCACIAGIAGDYCEYEHIGFSTYTTTQFCAWGCCETDCCNASTGEKVGVVVGSIAGAVVLGVLAVLLRRCIQKRRMGTVIRRNPTFMVQTGTTTNCGVQYPGAPTVSAPPPYPSTQGQISGFSNPSYS